MVAILYPRRLRNQLDVTQPAIGIPDGGVPVLYSSNSSFVIETHGGGGANFSAGASTLGNTLGDTGITGSRLVLAGIGNLTLSQATDANGGTLTISGGSVAAGAFSGGVSGGNTAGATGATGTRLVFAGGNNVTLSQATDVNGGTITISGANSAAPQTVQTQNRFNLTLSGNTAGALQEVSSGTLTLAGGNGVTLSQAGNAITISGSTFSQSVQPETQTFVGGISASNTLYTSGTVNFTGSGIVTVQSGTGQRVIINASQSVQPETKTFLGALAASNTTYTSGTVTITGVGGGVTVSSNTGQRIDISVAAQSVQTQNLHNVTISGNTSGALAAISSGTLTLAGGNNITISQAGNALTISGANAAGAQTAISGIAASNATYTSGSVTFTGVGGGVTVSSNTGQRVDISVAAPVAQTGTQFSAGISGGNTSGNSGTVAGRVVFAGGNNITLSGSTNGVSESITISAFNQSAQTGISSIVASDATYTSGSVQFTGSNMITVKSSANQRVVIDATQSVQTQNMVAVTLSGNTSGALAGISSGTMTIAGGNNITVSQAGNAFTISGANVGGAQTGISGIANSQTTYTSGTVSMSELGAITIRSTTGNQYQFSVNSQSVQTQSLFSAGVSTGGNTLGDTGVTGTRMVFVGSNNITLSQGTAAAGATITISGPTTAAQTNQSGGGYAVGNTYSSSSGTFDARTLSIRGDGIISVAATNSGWRISATQSVQPETQTFLGGVAASNTTYTSGTFTITGVGGGITVSSNTGQRIDLSVAAQTVESQSFGMSNIGNTSGTTGIASGGQVRFLLAGGNNITLSQSVNGASGTITISAPTQSAQTGISGLANSQTTYTSGTVSMSELGAITIRSTTGNQYQFSVNAQTGTQFSAGISGGNTAGDTGTVAGRVVFAGGANITVSGSTNGASETISIVGGAGGAFSGGVSNVGNSSGDTGITGSRLVLAGGNSITLSQSTNASGGTITVSAPNASVLSAVAPLSTSTNGSTISILGPAQLSVGFSTAGNTSGDTGFVTGRLALVGGNNITLSGSTNAGSQTITISAGAGGGFSGGVSNVGNTSGDTGITGSRLVLAGTNGITLSQSTNASGGTVTVSGITQSVQPGVQQFVVSNTTFSSGTVSISGFGDVTVNTAANIIRISAPTQTAQTGISGVANSQTTYTSGTVSLSELGAITIRSTTGNQYQFSVAAQTAQTGISGLANSQTTYTSGTVSMSELGAITIRSTTGNQYQFSVAAQTVESQSIGASNLGNTLGTSGVASGGQVRAVIIGTSNITVSQSVNGASATMSLIGQPSFSAGLSTGGNTQGNTGVSGTRLVLVATNNITMSQNTDANGATISISGQSPTGGQFSAGVSTGGNTAGATGISGSQLVLVGTGNISLSQTTGANGATVSINNTVSAFQAGVSTGGNTTGDTGVTGTRLVLVGSSPITLSQATGANGATVSINAPATSSLSGVSNVVISTNGSTISIGYRDPLADWENMPRQAASLVTHVSGFSKTPIYWNDHIDGQLTAKSLAFAISMVTASQPLSLSAHLGIYTLVNSTSANLLGSVSEAYVVSSASSVSLSGVRNLVMTGIGTHTALSVITAGEYMIGMMFSATATNAMNASLLGASGGAGALGLIHPGTNQLSTGTSQGIQALAGRGSTTVNAMPAAVSQADLVNQGTAGSMPLHPWIYIRS